jgi:hypothetical protein
MERSFVAIFQRALFEPLRLKALIKLKIPLHLNGVLVIDGERKSAIGIAWNFKNL